MNNPCLVVEKVFFAYPKNGSAQKNILSRASFSLFPGEIVSVIGENGCGKSTLLNLVAGFLEPCEGEVVVDRKRVSVVFQDIGLLEWKNAFENVELGLISSDLDSSQRKIIVDENLSLLGVLGAKDKFPKELSGGMKQRVAIARALASNPKVLLLDEPFSALDWKTKRALQEELLKIIKKKKIGVILVTHDLNEAAFFSDKVLMLSGGKLNKVKLNSKGVV
jgi:ABC-type nitrate/sulfonate/bicarbonate transport system ATPase subunit